jgi:hypothetical protein
METRGPLKKESGWLMGFCPSHPDGKTQGRRSLGLSLTSGWVKCFAGCDFKDIIQALQLDEQEVVPVTGQPSTTRPDTDTLVATYTATDADGQPVALKGRFEGPTGKRFTWAQVPAEGEPITWGTKGIKATDLLPWQHEKLSEATDDTWVIVCEGEKATQACIDHGLIAISWWAGSSQKVFPGLALLAGRKVAIWPDADEPGRTFAARLRKKVLTVARRVVVLPAEGEDKRDAHDFFKTHGDEAVDKLVVMLAGPRPHVIRINEDHFVVRFRDENGLELEFDFDAISYQRRDLLCELSVSIPEIKAPPYAQRMNILSISQRSLLVRSLRDHFSDASVNWTRVISQCIAAVRAEVHDKERGIVLLDVKEPETLPWIVDRILPENQPSVIFGDGESGKSWWTYAVALSIALGEPLAGNYPPSKTAAVLIFDYESGRDMARLRVGRLLRGLGKEEGKPEIYYWDANGIPLVDQVEPLRRYIRDMKIGLMICDSGGPACGGSPEEAQAAIAYFGAIGSLPCTTVTICHTTKATYGQKGDPERPFGSVYWHNLARRTFFVKPDHSDPSTLRLALISKKLSNGIPRHPPFGFVFSFDGEEGIGPVSCDELDYRGVTSFSSLVPLTERVELMIKQGPMQFAELMKEFEMRGDQGASRLLKVLRWGEKEGRWHQKAETSPVEWAIGPAPADW